MGRPVNKKYLGTAVNDLGVVVSARPTGDAALGQIDKQRGTKKFQVTTANGTGVCTLVDKAQVDLAVGEMSMVGVLNGSDVRIAKLYNRTARDFNNNRYTWTLTDDASSDYITLTAL